MTGMTGKPLIDRFLCARANTPGKGVTCHTRHKSCQAIIVVSVAAAVVADADRT